MGAFADEHGIPKAYGDYTALLNDPDVDCVVNTLPNGMHHEWTLRAIASGKHVLCEKPFTSNAVEASEVARAAAKKGVIVMEAFHWRYHPFFRCIHDALHRRAAIGTVRELHFHFGANLDGYCKQDDNGVARAADSIHSVEDDIRYKWEHSGGVTMDLGAYCINFIRHVTGEEPRCLKAKAGQWNQDPRIDESMEASFALPSGAQASFFATFQAERDGNEAGVYVILKGDKGTMRIENVLFPFKSSLLQVRHDGAVVEEELDRFGSAKTGTQGHSTYYHQLVSFCAAVSSGGSLALPTDAADAVKNMQVIDDVYKAAGMQPRGPQS